MFHTSLVVPVTGSTVSLTYPRWIQGYHTPTGPLLDVVGLKVTADGRPLEWNRDPVDLYTIRIDPHGAREIEVTFDFVFLTDGDVRSEEPSTTEKLAVLNWHTVVMAPTGAANDSVMVEPSLRLPSGWGYATALPGHAHGVAGSDVIRFDTVSLMTLLDSPVLAGLHQRSIELTPGEARPVWLDMACDSPEGLAISAKGVEAYRRLVAETDALFGSRHYRDYHFLVAMSDKFGGSATEHHESSDNRVFERSWLDGSKGLMIAALLSHEYVHSWNGKYRRPAGLATRNNAVPMQDDLLWVYEGLTEYLGKVLAARAGTYTTEQCREDLASTAAYMDYQTGRAWRPLIDTAREAPLLYDAPREWRAWRRGIDFYSEGVLIWLEADVTIRKLTGGRKSLDDFCRAFYGGASGPPQVVPYRLDDVVRALDQVAHHDWRTFFDQRVDRVTPRAPLGGLEGAGWRLVYRDSASEDVTTAEDVYEYVNLTYSLGLRIASSSGSLTDVLTGLPAAEAGIAPGMTLIAVNGRKWSKGGLVDALKASRAGHGPIELLCSNEDFYRTFTVDDHGGPRYPWLERIPGRSDVLSKILAPRRGRASASTPGVH
jgi:predicted metalloprotease with PDZ domain